MLLQMASPIKVSGPVGEEGEEERKPAPTVAAKNGNLPVQDQRTQTANGPPEQAKENTAAETQPDLTRSLFTLNALARRVSRMTGPAAAFLWKPVPLWGGAEADPSFFAVPVAVIASVLFSFIIAACIVVRYQPRRSKLDMQFEHVRFAEAKEYRLSKSLRSNCW